MTYMHPTHKRLLNLASVEFAFCFVCHNSISNNAYRCQDFCRCHICFKCALPLQEDGSGPGTIHHWSHQHPLRLLRRYATFECDGCNNVATDFSYMCDKCSYWIHQSCASLSHETEFIGIHHKHPLRISDSLPQVYHKFSQFCKICNLKMDPSRWLYYCANCRFFAHIHCAVSRTRVLSLHRHEDDDPELIHLPAPDELLMNSMMQKCIKDMISLSVNTAVAPPYRINHWAHEHPLTIKNKSALRTGNDDWNPESERLIICGGCKKPISTFSDDADVFNECNQCNYSLHRYCAQFPKEIHRDLGLLNGFHGNFFRCNGCQVYSYGFHMDVIYQFLGVEVWLDVCCACLPQKIKHQAHHHPLEQFTADSISFGKEYGSCKACRCLIDRHRKPLFFGCGSCDFYIHRDCALKPRTMTHRWDPHPLRLVLSLENDVEEHPHEFQCEFCSEEIDTNGWFYHCNICDLSFHIDNCITACSSDVKVWHSRDRTKIMAHQSLRQPLDLITRSEDIC